MPGSKATTGRTYSGSLSFYEGKLTRVMERFGVSTKGFNWNVDRFGAFVEFSRKGQFYRMEQTVVRAAGRGVKLKDGADCLAQLVLTLEDLARMAERGIYDLEVWVAGLLALPAGAAVPGCFLALGLDRIPATIDEVHTAWKAVVKRAHPDGGGTAEGFRAAQLAYQQAQEHFRAGAGVVAR